MDIDFKKVKALMGAFHDDINDMRKNYSELLSTVSNNKNSTRNILIDISEDINDKIDALFNTLNGGTSVIVNKFEYPYDLLKNFYLGILDLAYRGYQLEDSDNLPVVKKVYNWLDQINNSLMRNSRNDSLVEDNINEIRNLIKTFVINCLGYQKEGKKFLFNHKHNVMLVLYGIMENMEKHKNGKNEVSTGSGSGTEAIIDSILKNYILFFYRLCMSNSIPEVRGVVISKIGMEPFDLMVDMLESLKDGFSDDLYNRIKDIFTDPYSFGECITSAKKDEQSKLFFAFQRQIFPILSDLKNLKGDPKSAYGVFVSKKDEYPLSKGTVYYNGQPTFNVTAEQLKDAIVWIYGLTDGDNEKKIAALKAIGTACSYMKSIDKEDVNDFNSPYELSIRAIDNLSES